MAEKVKGNSNKAILIASLVAVLVIAVAVIVIIRSFSGNSKYENKFETGNKFLLEMKYDEAIECFEEALRLDPSKIENYLYLASAYILAGRYDDASSILMQAYSHAGDGDAEKINRLLEYLEECKEGISHEGNSDILNIIGANSVSIERTGDITVKKKGSEPDAPIPDSTYLTTEQQKFLGSVISYAKGHKDTELANLAFSTFHSGTFKAEDRVPGESYKTTGNDFQCVYNGYVIHFYFQSTEFSYDERVLKRDWFTLDIIPSTEGEGYLYASERGADGAYYDEYASFEIKKGLPNGSFTAVTYGFDPPYVNGYPDPSLPGGTTSKSIYKGESVDGYVDGRVDINFTYCDENSTITNASGHAVFNKGVVTDYEEDLYNQNQIRFICDDGTDYMLPYIPGGVYEPAKTRYTVCAYGLNAIDEYYDLKNVFGIRDYYDSEGYSTSY